MGMNFLSNSSISPLNVEPHKPVKSGRRRQKNTVYEIESIELPYELSSADQRQIFELAEKILAQQEIRTVHVSKEKLEIAYAIVNQLKEYS